MKKYWVLYIIGWIHWLVYVSSIMVFDFPRMYVINYLTWAVVFWVGGYLMEEIQKGGQK